MLCLAAHVPARLASYWSCCMNWHWCWLHIDLESLDLRTCRVLLNVWKPLDTLQPTRNVILVRNILKWHTSFSICFMGVERILRQLLIWHYIIGYGSKARLSCLLFFLREPFLFPTGPHLPWYPPPPLTTNTLGSLLLSAFPTRRNRLPWYERTFGDKNGRP